MAGRNARGAIRASRRNVTRLVVTPPRDKEGLLRGTALTGGSLFAPAKPTSSRKWFIAGSLIVGGVFGAMALPGVAFAESDCGGVSGGGPYDVTCNSGGNSTYAANGINYTDPSTDVPGNMTIHLNGVTFTTTDPGYNAGAVNYYSGNNAYDITLTNDTNTPNSITGTGVDGVYLETVGGHITVKSLGSVSATGTRTSDPGGNYGYSYTGSEVNGYELISHGGDIDVTLHGSDSVTSSGNGLYIDASVTPYGINDSVNPTGTPVPGGGDVNVTNYGHIAGGTGAGVDIRGADVATVDNHSLTSMTGAVGLAIGWSNVADVDNRSGLIGGTTYDGLQIHNIAESQPITGDAVSVDNTRARHKDSGGIIAGNTDGVSIYDIGSTYASGQNTVSIDNYGSWRRGNSRPGGLIVGVTGDGVSLDDVQADVSIDNSRTLNNGSNDITAYDSVENPNGIDSSIATLIGTPLANAMGDDFLRDTSGNTTGIWGLEGSGIDGSDIAGSVSVNNEQGLIVGQGDQGSGISLSGVGSGLNAANEDNAVYVDNSNVWWGGSGGLITGGDYGVRLSGIENGDVVLDNTKGTVYGDEIAFALGGTEEDAGLIGGNVTIYNSRGLIEGADGSDADFGGGVPGADSLGAITINNVQSVYDEDTETYYGGHVFIYNENEDGRDGGSIIGVDSASAIVIGSYLNGEGVISADDNSAVDTADIDNGSPHNIWSLGDDDSRPITGGLIAGSGGPNANAVIVLNTSSSYVNDDENYTNGYIGNAGVIASTNIEGFVDPDADPNNTQTDLRPFLTDAYNVASYVESGGLDSSLSSSDFQSALGRINNINVAYNPTSVTGAATDSLIESSVGATWIENYGALLGTVNLTGSNQYYDTDLETNLTAGNEIDNYGGWFTQGTNTATWIYNEGLIQTAFGAEVPTNTTFDVETFYNDDLTYNGYLSSLDGVSGNTTEITGDFYGSDNENDAHSYVALDAYLDKTGGTPSADLLKIDGAAYGTTGLIVNNINSAPLTGDNTDGILVVQVDSPDGDGCTEVACKDGDTFYISNRSANYLNVNGYGLIQQGGFYGWYLTERDNSPNENEDGYYLVTTALPTANQVPQMTTAFINLFYAGSDIVAEHLYGGHFPLTGTDGYGADVTPQGPDQSKTNSAIWARASGSWTNQSSTVDTGLGPFNSSFNQDTYTLLGGVDMSPDAGASGLRLGAFGGYGQSNLSFSNYGTTGKFTGGEVGGYAAYTQGGFYADAQVDGDFMRAHFDAPIGGGATIDTDGTALGVLANIGDRMYMGKNFFEPLASFAYVNTSLGDQTVGGDSVHFSNGESLRAGVGARIGTTQKVKDGLVEYTLLGRVWNEFAGDNTVTISDGVNPPQTFTDNNHGVLGEVSGTVTFADTKTNLSTFISGGGIFGADSTTWDAKAGVRKEF